MTKILKITEALCLWAGVVAAVSNEWEVAAALYSLAIYNQLKCKEIK